MQKALAEGLSGAGGEEWGWGGGEGGMCSKSSPNEDRVLEEQDQAESGHKEEAPRLSAGPRLDPHTHSNHTHVQQRQDVGGQECSDQQGKHGNLQPPILHKQSQSVLCEICCGLLSQG